MISIVLQLADELGHHVQDYFDGVQTRSAYYTLRPVEYRHRQPVDIPLDINHGRQVGTIEYLERRRDGSLWGAAVADDNQLLTVHDPIYASPAISSRPDGTDIQLRAVALTFHPAAVGLRPAVLVPGDFRRIEVRCHWHNQTPQKAFLERAADYTSRRRYRSPLTIQDADLSARGQVKSRDDDHRGSSTRPVDTFRPAGPIYHSAPHPGIISVS